MKKTLYFVRHGETDWNVLGKLQGQTDVPLNENGIMQAKELSERIDIKIDYVFSFYIFCMIEKCTLCSGLIIQYLVKLFNFGSGNVCNAVSVFMFRRNRKNIKRHIVCDVFVF